jgi:hypothetical protein
VPVPVPTPDEIVQLLKHTSMPTLLVEGPSDADLFRIIEARSGLLGGTVLSCGGRSALLQIYDRRAEFSHLKCAFLADADMWHFSSVPPQYTGIIFTAGYAIENDILDGPAVERLLVPAEQAEFAVAIDCLSEWFAHEVAEWTSGRDPQLDVHINVLIPPGTGSLNGTWCATRGFTPPVPTLVAAIRKNYRVSLRGKQLIQALLRFLSAPARASKYSRYNLLEIAATSPEHARFAQLCSRIENSLS